MTGDIQKGQVPHGQPDQSQTLKELEALAASPGFIYTLAQVSLANSYYISDAFPDAPERLTVQELSLAAAFAAKQPLDLGKIPSEVELNAQVGELYSLLRQIHDVAKHHLRSAQENGTGTRPSFSADRSHEQSEPPLGEEMVEPLNYAGMGSYDFQHLELAPEKYSHDMDWFKSNVGLSIDSLVGIAKELQDLRERRLATFFKFSTLREGCRAALDAFSFTRDDLNFLTQPEFDAFLGKFSVTPGQLRLPVTTVGDLNDLEITPIIRLGEDRFFMPVGFMLAKSIYESPYYWMSEDSHYSIEAADHRGDATETIAHQFLSSVFGDRAYKNACVVDGKQTAGEIDVLVIHGNRALIVEAKAKRLTALSRKGNDQKLKQDFSQAVQGAYEQACASRQLLLTGRYNVLASDGTQIQLPVTFKEVYVVCITLDHIPALPYIVDQFIEKGPDDPYPVVMSVFGLDLVATYITDPLQFIHYIHQRARWSDRIFASWEGSLLALYLKDGLAQPQDSIRIALTENAAIDLEMHFMSARGRHDLLTKLYSVDGTDAGMVELITRWQENGLTPFLNSLRENPEPWGTDALFMLFDQPESSLNALLEVIEENMQSCAEGGELSYGYALFNQKVGTSFVCFPELSEADDDLVAWLPYALKHKNKADVWVDFWHVLGKPVIGAGFVDRTWEARIEFDLSVQRLLGPNEPPLATAMKDPCWCGGGDTYDNCHAAGI